MEFFWLAMDKLLLLILLLLLPLLATLSNGIPTIYPIQCNKTTSSVADNTCSSYMYASSRGLSPSAVASLYSANASLVKTIVHPPKTEEDFLVGVTCRCEDAGGGTVAYFHDTRYTVGAGDTGDNITSTVFSGLAWEVDEVLVAGETIDVRLACGCYGGGGGGIEEQLHELVSYAVQPGDTLSTIANLFSADQGSIERLNQVLTANPEFLIPGWVLFVPMGSDLPPPKEKKKNNILILAVSFSVAFTVIGSLILFYRCRSRWRDRSLQQGATTAKNLSAMGSIAALESQYLPKNKDTQGAESSSGAERPVTYSLQAVEEATSNFDGTRKIGEGGYGSVYYGVLGKLEVAIKKMKSSKSREFFAELKVLCKVHHINVVELIGYASGDDHLYLVYEYVQNGSLNEHLHDPLLKGHQPLSWNARAQIAFDAARGIEYIHDHTKARYVHRDIKTSNILLDEGLRAKVADFGLAKLVERSNGEEDCIATRLVGTPGYLPPESVRELQMTTKADVFAFGVVLAELITGQRALIRDKKEPNRTRSLISIMNGVFRREDPHKELEAIIDGNLKDNYPPEEVYKMAEISAWCLEEDSVNRPEMREITVRLSEIVMASIEWEASLGGNSQIFSGIFNGR